MTSARFLLLVVFAMGCQRPSDAGTELPREERIDQLDAEYDEVAGRERLQTYATEGPPHPLPGKLVRECLDSLPSYDGCNAARILEAAALCAGGHGSHRLFDNRGAFPALVGGVLEHPLVVGYHCSDVCPDGGGIFLSYRIAADEDHCRRRGGTPLRGGMSGYFACAPAPRKDCPSDN